MKTVDEVTETMRVRVSGGAGGGGGNGARALDAAVATWPGLSVAGGAGTCRGCARPAVARLLLFGQPYNPATLEVVQPDARLAYEKVDKHILSYISIVFKKMKIAFVLVKNEKYWSDLKLEN